MRHIIIYLIVLLLLLCPFKGNTSSCYYPPLHIAANKADLFIIGKILSIDTIYKTKVIFEIESSNTERNLIEKLDTIHVFYKHKVAVIHSFNKKIRSQKSIDVYVSDNVGYSFQLGNVYLIDGSKRHILAYMNKIVPTGSNIFWTSWCSHTTLAQDDIIQNVNKEVDVKYRYLDKLTKVP